MKPSRAKQAAHSVKDRDSVHAVLRVFSSDGADDRVAVYSRRAGLVGASKRRRPDWVAMRRGEYEALMRAAEDAADVGLLRRAATDRREKDYLPASLVERMIGGESAVRIWREHRSLSAVALARKADMPPSYLSEIERGRKPGSVKALRALALALDLDLDDLVP